MDGCLLSLWESFINRRREENQLKKDISLILELLADKNDEETWMLAFSLALETLPEYILNYCISSKDNHYVDYYEYLKDPLTLKDILELGLKHKEIEPVRKHTYSFIWGTKLTVTHILYNIIV